ncbi:hypothetical protein AcV5_007032 [Taiwanofungus camphoratus]|nr:hypothetical protein AcV5_007032 [Antrodia cinnamomea]
MSFVEDQSKSYAERGVQTDNVQTQTVLPCPSMSMSSTRVQNVSDSMVAAQLSPLDASPASTQFDSAYSHTSDHSYSSDSTSPARSISTTVRSYKRQQLPYVRPAQFNSPKAVSSRLVSLPETVSVYSAKATLEKTALRVVSMPLPTNEDTSFLSHIDVSACAEPFLPGDEGQSRVRVRSHASDIPHTPSPPSSPESIVIIANKDQLSEGFLRSSAHVEDDPATAPNDEGWITWAKSPPRPIPALHGPLSLPYARCPSGAEGTIIEEQDNLPRMIWGLEGEDMPSSRSRSDTVFHTSTHPIPRRGLSHLNPGNVPPRFQKTKPEVEPSPVTQFGQHDLHEFRHPRLNAPELKVQAQQSPSGYPLRGQEPIDLSEIVRQHAENTMSGFYPDYELISSRAQGLGHDLRSHDLGYEPGLDWQAVLLAQERLKDIGVLSSSSSHANGLGDRFKTTLSASISPLQYLGSSRSPIVLDPQPSLLPQASRSAMPPRRMSALEIAQQYRQQQIQQQQSLLPTPPNSSSPIWSSNFSPHQDSVISPELLSVSRLPKLSPTSLQSYAEFTHSASTQQLRQSPQNRLNSLVLTNRAVNASSLAPAAQIKDNSIHISQTHPCVYVPDVPLVNSLSSYLQSQNLKVSDVRLSTNRVERSPVQSRPPPNTPMVSMSSPRGIARSDGPAQPVTASPLSPTSPKPRLRSFSHQQTRSIPLTRLIQRRLSSVPEEDFNPAGDDAHAPSPAARTQRARSYSSGMSSDQAESQSHVHFLLSPPSPLHQTPRTPSPFHHTLVPQSKISSPQTGAEQSIVETGASSFLAQATVKLPGATTRHGLPSSHTGHSGNGRDDSGRRREGSTRGQDSSRNRGQRKAGRGRKGRGTSISVVNGPERVDGGLVVKS